MSKLSWGQVVLTAVAMAIQHKRNCNIHFALRPFQPTGKQSTTTKNIS